MHKKPARHAVKQQRQQRQSEKPRLQQCNGDKHPELVADGTLLLTFAASWKTITASFTFILKVMD